MKSYQGDKIIEKQNIVFNKEEKTPTKVSFKIIKVTINLSITQTSTRVLEILP